MQYKDLLDIHDVLICVRFSLEDPVSFHLINVLEEALYENLGAIFGIKGCGYKSIRAHIQSNCAVDFRFGSLDNLYSNKVLVADPSKIIVNFLILVHFIKKALMQGNYEKAFKIVDDIHELPLAMFKERRNALKTICRYVERLKPKDYLG